MERHIRSISGTAPALTPSGIAERVRGGAAFATRFAVCIALCSLAGCGSSGHDADTTKDDGEKMGSVSTKDASMGKPVDAGDPSAPAACEDVMCEASDDGRACCLDKKTGFCGIIGDDTQCHAVADPRCPSVKGMLGDMASCCTTAGQCGLDLAWTGNGCVSLASKTLRGFTPDAPEPRACDASDAGASDAGAK